MLTSHEPENENVSLVVEQLWCISDSQASGFETRLPAGRAQLIFSLSGVSLLDGEPHRGPLEIFQGPMTVARRIPRKPQFSACGVSFRPGGAGALFGAIDEFADQIVDLSHFWGEEARRLREELGDLETHAARLKRLEDAIGHYTGNTDTVELIARGLELLTTGMTIQEMCRHLGLSPHIFRKLFQQNVGMTCKRFLRIERFRVAISQLTTETPLSHLALEACYADQSHMTREFVGFASLSPGSLRQRNRPYVGHVRD